jgi:hypothetical protein
MSKHTKNRLPPFVPLLVATLDSPAWRAMSHGAKSLYVSLKRRVPRGRNVAYLSYRDAAVEVNYGKDTVRLRFEELQHFGFIVLARPGCLGVDGKGRAPLWRLTELGQTRRTSAAGNFEPPTNDFLRWDGTPFRSPRKNRIPSTREGQGVYPWRTPLSTREGHPNPEVSTREGQSGANRCLPVEDITRFTTPPVTPHSNSDGVSADFGAAADNVIPLPHDNSAKRRRAPR